MIVKDVLDEVNRITSARNQLNIDSDDDGTIRISEGLRDEVMDMLEVYRCMLFELKVEKR